MRYTIELTVEEWETIVIALMNRIHNTEEQKKSCGASEYLYSEYWKHENKKANKVLEKITEMR